MPRPGPQDSRRAFGALWGAISALTRGSGLPGTQFDKLRSARLPGRRLLGGNYLPGSHPVLIGPGKCAKKGHRPLSDPTGMLKAVFTPDELTRMRAETCTRCWLGWRFKDPTVRPWPEGTNPFPAA